MQQIHKLKKRSGEIVSFDESKIKSAVRKAFFAITDKEHEEEAQKITALVVERLTPMFKEGTPTPSVEDVQDLVERGIMEEGYFDVAKAYILYRYEHTKKREEKKQEVIKKLKNRNSLLRKETARKKNSERIN